jgi:hypothetical protein
MARIKEQEAAEAALIRHKLGLPSPSGNSAHGATSTVHNEKPQVSTYYGQKKLGEDSTPPATKKGKVVILRIKDDRPKQVERTDS